MSSEKGEGIDWGEPTQLAQALCAYTAEEERVLSFIKGETLFCWSEDVGEWLWARKQNGDEGYIPRTLVRLSMYEDAEERALRLAIELSLRDKMPLPETPIATAVPAHLVEEQCLRPPSAPPLDLLVAQAVSEDGSADLLPNSIDTIQIPSPVIYSATFVDSIHDNTDDQRKNTSHKSPLRKVASFLVSSHNKKKEIKSLRQQNSFLEQERIRLEHELLERRQQQNDNESPRSPHGNAQYYHRCDHPASCPVMFHRQRPGISPTVHHHHHTVDEVDDDDHHVNQRSSSFSISPPIPPPASSLTPLVLHI